VVVAVVLPLDADDRLAAVDGLEHRHLREPDDVGVLGVHGEGAVVPGALAEAVVAVDELPVVAAVVGAEQAALLRLDQGVDAAAVRRGDGDADLAPGPLRQAAGQLLPGVAAVARDVQAAAGAAADELPRPPPGLPQA